jgi:hypothetical protein
MPGVPVVFLARLLLLDNFVRKEALRQLPSGQRNSIGRGRIVRDCSRSLAGNTRGLVVTAKIFLRLADHALNERIVLICLI